MRQYLSFAVLFALYFPGCTTSKNAVHSYKPIELELYLVVRTIPTDLCYRIIIVI